MDDVYGIVGTLLDGKYQVEAAVAEGGFGVVYRATHRSLQKPVALKLLKVPDDFRGDARAAFLASFADEARTTARLDHPAIVRVTDFGVLAVASGQRVPWMVLDWLDGETLAAHLDARRGRGGVTPAEALALLRPAFEALAWAHARGVVHRDLKPSNIMLVDEGAVPLRVLDFGIAKVLDGPAPERPSGETRSGTAGRAFSPGYAAPEQVGGTRTGPWTDVHALALVLTEVLTDAPPYEASDGPESALDLSLAALSPTRPTPLRRGVDVGAWEPVLARAAALRPGDRYPDAGALLAALDAALPDATPRAATVDAPPITAQPITSQPITSPSAPRVETLPRDAIVPRVKWRRALAAAAVCAALVATYASVARRGAVETRQTPAPQPLETPSSDASTDVAPTPVTALPSPSEAPAHDASDAGFQGISRDASPARTSATRASSRRAHPSIDAAVTATVAATVAAPVAAPPPAPPGPNEAPQREPLRAPPAVEHLAPGE